MASLNDTAAEQVQSAFNAIVYAKAAQDPHAEVRAESRLFDVCLSHGMSFDEPNHIEWAAERIGEWLVRGNA